MVGQNCLSVGSAKNTYGTGCFMLYNVGEDVVQSNAGMLSTVGYKLGASEPPVYALEGSVAVAGSAINWLKSIGLLENSSESEAVARSVETSGGLVFVPAFNGLFAPHWRPDARGLLIGVTQYTNKGHIVRATLEAVAFQIVDILEAMQKDSKSVLKSLYVDGGMTQNDLLMEIQAEFLGIPVIRPKMLETTALGAAICAAIGAGVTTIERVKQRPQDETKVFRREKDVTKWEEKFRQWRLAIDKSCNWDVDTKSKL